MDLTHLHLTLNHIPVVGLVIGFLLLVWGVLKTNREIRNTGLVTIAITSLMAIPVYLTGRSAEEIAEKLPGVTEQLIDVHESAAMFSLVLCMIVGAVAIATLIGRRFVSEAINLAATLVVLVLVLLTGASIAYTANLGGQLRHNEIRQSPSEGPTSGSRIKESRDDDDDH